jgi:hypothetical protein
MPLNLGATAISTLRLGTATPSKVMLGASQVWPVAPPSNLWTPADMPGVLFWLDGSDASKFGLNGSNVSSWSSSVGSVTFTQESAGAQPVKIAGGVQGGPGLNLGSTNIVYPTTNYTLIAIMQALNANATANVSLGINSAFTQGLTIELTTGDKVRLNIMGSPVVDTPSINRLTSQQIVTCRRSNNNFSVYNANTNASSAITFTNFLGFAAVPSYVDAWMFDGTVVQDYDSSGMYFQVALVNSSVSIADAQKLEGSMAWLAGAQGQLHAAHPYKNAPPTK